MMGHAVPPGGGDSPALLGGRLSRRQLFTRTLQTGAVIGGGTVVAALLDACGGTTNSPSATLSTGSGSSSSSTGSSSSGTTTTSTPAPAAASTGTAGTLTIPLISNPTPNPITLPGGLSSILLNKNLFGQLCRPDANNPSTPTPDHAEKWEISTDGLTYTFHLRQGLKFHDGTPLTADDVKFTFDSITDPKVNGAFKNNLGPFDHAEVVDPQTVNLIMKQAYGPLMVMLDYNIMIVPKHVLSGQDLNKPVAYIQNPIASGPYKFKEFVSGDHLTLVANPDYWDGAPKIGTVVYKILPDVNTQVAQLRTGEVDVVMIEPSQVDALSGQSNVVINTAAQTNYYYLGVNNSNPLFSDVRVRQALAYALDRQTIVTSVMRDKATLANGPISPPMGWAYPKDQQPFPYDVKKAQDLLTQAGWALQNGKLMKDGKPFAFKILLDVGNPTRKSFALAAQQYYQKLGMDPQIDSEDFNKWYDMSSNSQYDLAVEWWITPPDPDALYGGYSDDNTDKYKNADVDNLFLQGRQQSTPDKRAPIYAQLQQKLYQDQVDVFMLYPEEFRGFSKRLQGYTNIGIRDALYYTYKWTLNG